MDRLKMRDMKQRHSQKCRDGNCEKRKLWHSVAGGGKCGTSLYGQPKVT